MVLCRLVSLFKRSFERTYPLGVHTLPVGRHITNPALLHIYLRGQHLDKVTSGKVNTAMTRMTVWTGTMGLQHTEEEGNPRACFGERGIPELPLEEQTP